MKFPIMACKTSLLLLNKLNVLLLALIYRRKKRMKEQRKRKMWVQKLFTERRTKGEFNILVKDLMLFDHFYFFRMFRMNPSRFEESFSSVAPSVIKCSKLRDIATPSERLCITLRYFAIRDTQATIASRYRVSPPVVGRIIHNTCDTIWAILNSKEYLKTPANNNEWMEIENEFREK